MAIYRADDKMRRTVMASAGGAVDVVIVGAGISGLSCAKELTEKGLNVVVLEARDRVGGRTLTKTDPKVGYVDLGGSYIGPTQDRVLRMIGELGIQMYFVNEEQDLIFYNKGKRWRFNNDIFPVFYNIFTYLDLNNVFRKLDEMGKQVPLKEPWTCPRANEWDTMTVKEFLEQTCYTKGAKQYLEMLMSLIVTVNVHEGSLLWFLWYLQQCGGMTRVISTTNGGQERKCIGGSQQISVRLAQKLKEKVVLSSPVAKITQTENHVEVQTLAGKVYRANHVIMALSPSLQSKIHYDPPMPPLRNQLMQRCPMGSVMKCIVYYERPFWRDLGFCGSTLIVSDSENPCVATFDDTKPDGIFPAIVGFNVADTLRDNHTLSREDRMMLFARSLAKIFGTDEALKVVHYEEKNWMEEQYSGGCYVGTFPPGFLTRFGRIIREPVGRIHYAGTETATHWAGYMEGAIQAGERAAREVLCRMGRLPQSLVWQDEPSSQEVPARPFPRLWRENLPSPKTLIHCMNYGLVLGLALYLSAARVGGWKALSGLCLERIWSLIGRH